MLEPESDAPSFGHFVRVRRPQHNQPRNAAQRDQLLDRLVGRAVLPDPDRIMGEHVDNRKLHDRAEPDRRLHVVGEDQEARTKRPELRQREPVADRAHRVLTDAEMKVSGTAVIGFEIASAVEGQPGLGRGRQIGGPAEEPRQAGRDRVQHMCGRVAARDAIRIGGENRNVLIPPIGQVAPLHALTRVGELGISCPVSLEQRHPFAAEFLAAGAEILCEVLVDPVRDEKFRVLRPTVGAFSQFDFFFAQRLAMGAGGVLLVRRAVADMARHDDQAGSVLDAPGDRDRLGDALPVIGVADPLHVPAVCQEPAGHVLAEGESSVALDRDVVAVVDPAQIAEPQMPGERGGLAPHPLHHAAVAAQCEDVVVEQREIRPIEMPRQPIGADRHADAGRNPLPERSRRGFDTRGQVIFRMARAFAAELAKGLQIVERDGRGAEPLVALIDRLDAGQMQHRIEQGRGMAGGQHKAVPVGPDRVLRIKSKEILPQRADDRRHRHRRAGMAGFRLLHRIDAQGANGVDTDLVDRAARRHHVVPRLLNRSHWGDCAGRERAAAMRSTFSSTGRSIPTVIGFSSGPGASRVENWLSSRLAGMK